MIDREQVVRVSQECETPGRLVRRSTFSYRYAYARSSDNQVGGERGQDYLALREDQQRLAFALCDGVSQSFFGDLAARSVGDALVEWLWHSRDLPADPAVLQDRLRLVLQRLTSVVSAQAGSVSLPHHLPAMVRDVLERKRAFGTQTTFVAGLIDTDRHNMWLAWLGDSRIRFWDDKGIERTGELGDTFHVAERWSSDRGVLGDIHTHSVPLRGVSRLVAYSDGLQPVASWLSHTVGNRVLDGLIAQVVGSSASDDVSFLEVWMGSAPAFEGDTVPPSTQMVQIPAVGAATSLSPVGGPPGQRMDAAAVPGRRARTIRPAWVVPIAVAGGLLCVAAAVGSSRLLLVRRPAAVPTASGPIHNTTTVASPSVAAPALGATGQATRSPPERSTATTWPTDTPRPTVMPAPSDTPEPAWTASPTPTRTTTPTPTDTPSPSPMPTTTPMFTWTPLPSPTTTPMQTWTPTSTPTRTATPTWTHTPSPTLSATGTASATPTPTVASTQAGESPSAPSPTVGALVTEPAPLGEGEGGELLED